MLKKKKTNEKVVALYKNIKKRDNDDLCVSTFMFIWGSRNRSIKRVP